MHVAGQVGCQYQRHSSDFIGLAGSPNRKTLLKIVANLQQAQLQLQQLFRDGFGSFGDDASRQERIHPEPVSSVFR